MKIEALCNEDEPLWDAFVHAHPGASIYHLAGWRHLIADVFGHPAHYLMARDEQGTVTGVLPVVRIQSRLFGHYMVSLPYFTYGGPLGVDEATERELMHAAGALAGELGAGHVEFRGFEPREPAWATRTDKVTLHRPLAEDEDGLRKSLSRARRRQVKKAQDGESEVQIGGAALLDDFYTVFAENMRDLGTPVYDRRFFAAMLERFPDATRIVSVRREGRPAGAAFLVGFRDRLEVPWVSTRRSMNAHFVNTLLYWEQLRFAVSEGYRVFDFGRSSLDSGTYAFKRQWGAEPVQLHWQYWLAPGRGMPGLTPSSPKFRLAVRAWQHLPLLVANRLGPRIVKDLP
ncbi:MAG: FemAB family XrtA/PEP-CTERM system-associated protein [Myxococcota bacterium]